METALVAIVCVALVLVGSVAMIHSTLSSTDMVSTSWKEMEVRAGEIARTEVVVGETAQLEAGNTIVRLTITNEGQVSFYDFSKWDVMVQYYDAGDVYHILRATHTSNDPPGDDHWTNLSPTPVILEPEILNLGEQMEVKIQLAPAIKTGSDFLVAVATANGVTSSRGFSA